jgi:hypothetical protein
MRTGPSVNGPLLDGCTQFTEAFMPLGIGG